MTDSTRWMPAGPALLFAPADKPERFDKAAERSDMVILDLEDGCRPDNRPQARTEITQCALDPQRTVVRVSPASTSDFAEDIKAVKQTQFRQIMLAKTESSADVQAVLAELPDAEIITLIETPKGVVKAHEIAATDGVAAMFWGAEDLVAGLGGTASRRPDGQYRDVAQHARSTVMLAAAAYGRGALDAVHVDIADVQGLQEEAEDAAALGFVGTCCIHPSQVQIIRDAYRPSDEELDFARRLLAAAETNRGAFSFEGRMVDEPLFRQAQAIVARSGS